MRVVIIGAGLSGLTAARLLTDVGHQVTLIDKGRAVGGRMASKRVDGARYDIGAQHFSARSPGFIEVVDQLRAAGVVETWFQGQSVTDPERGVEPRFKGVPAMRSIAEHLAAGLDIRLGHRVDRLAVGADGVVVDDLPPVDRCLVTAPLPQTLELLGGMIDDASRRLLASVSYRPCLVAMLELDGPAGLEDGHLALDEGPIAWIGDNHHKGVSTVPAVTVHSSHEFAAEHLEQPPETWISELAAAARSHLGSSVTKATGHRWRYSLPANPLDVGALGVAEGVFVAGEALAGARIEGAYLSGIKAAEILT